MTTSPMVLTVFAFFCLAVVGVSFLVISKTLGGIGIGLLRLEYLLGRELELVREKERVKKQIRDAQNKDEEKRRMREAENDPLLYIPYQVKKEK